MATDAELLQRYAGQKDERAFADLVQRHLGLVYAAALRRTGGRAALAEEIAQKVFTDLARKAAALRGHPALTGWLYRTTRYAAIDAMRAETRRQKLTQTFATMPDADATRNEEVEWERLRPVLDEAMDEMKEADREAMLLRYFEGLSFAEVGVRLNLSENAARMRTERALEKLRVLLGRRGVTSTAVALGGTFAGKAFAAAPAGLAASVTTTALSGAAAAGAVSTLAVLGKLSLPAAGAVLAAGVTALVWTAVVPRFGADELSALRRERESLLAQHAAESHASPAAAGRASAAPAENTAAPAAPAVTPRGHRDHGTATPRAAALTFAWAGDIGDPEALARLVYFDPPVREKAMQVLATMPDTIRAQYPTAEAFYGLLLAAACLEAPPPRAELMQQLDVIELRPDRAAVRAAGSRSEHQFQRTPDGWRYVLPGEATIGLHRNLTSETLERLSRR